MTTWEEQVLETASPPDAVTLAHGSGGEDTRTLVDAVFKEAFGNPLLDRLDDSARFAVNGADLAFTTDSSVVSPLFFPGGDIGDLAVNGTVNDLAVSGATPLHLSVGFILEEGFPVADLRRITESMRAAADAAGVDIATGDTKVVQRGKADGCYINTSGVGVVHLPPTGDIRPGDAILVTGPIGDHGAAIMLARGELALDADLVSDTAPLNCLLADLSTCCPGAVRRMRDATRGGVASVLTEMASDLGLAVVVDETAIPVRPAVRDACELLAIDPLYVACGVRAVVEVAPDSSESALASLRAHPLGAEAAMIGRVHDDPPGTVILETATDGTRTVAPLAGAPLPRIC
jgi:hydrogenase expression/formation protein HypE